jgi:hypothetical protein
MTDIPKTAMPIAEYIRENVPRPKELPRIGEWGDKEFRSPKGRYQTSTCNILGLLSESKYPYPKWTTKNNFWPVPNCLTDETMTAFMDWWDRAEFWGDPPDPQAAINTIWGKP